MFSPSTVDYTQRKAFLKGAGNEVERINELLSGEDVSGAYKNYLERQRDLLKRERKKNSNYDSDEKARIREDYKKYAAEGGASRGEDLKYQDNRTQEAPDGVEPVDYEKSYQSYREQY